MKPITYLISALFILSACSDNKRDAIGKTEVCIETTEGDIVVRLYDDTPIHRDNFIRNVREGAHDGILFNRIVPDMVIQAGDTTLKLQDGGSRKATAAPEKIDLLPAEIIYPKHFHKQGALAAAREPDSINPQKQSSALQWYIVTGSSYTQTQLAELQATLYEAKVMARFEQLQKDHATEIAQLKATDRAAYQELLNNLQLQSEEQVAKNPPRPYNEAQKQVYTKQGGAPHLDGEYTVFGEVVEGMPIALRIGRTPIDSHERPRKQVGIKAITVRE